MLMRWKTKKRITGRFLSDLFYFGFFHRLLSFFAGLENRPLYSLRLFVCVTWYKLICIWARKPGKTTYNLQQENIMRVCMATCKAWFLSYEDSAHWLMIWHCHPEVQTWICTTWPSFPSFCRLLFLNYTKIGSFTSILSIRIVLGFFYLLITHFGNLSTWISRLP